QPDRDTRRDVAHERVRRVDRQSDRRERHGTEQDEHEQRADQAELLTEDGEDKVGVRLWQVAPLLLAGPEPLAEQTAAGHAEQPVPGLPTGALEVLERVD